ncbi:MAG: CRISPR-associated protein Cas4 [Ignavibacteriae bacterium]|nr:MAG: CRISPR-associated protein Cas4 [Ignavibacteriota bacterium]
MHITGVQIGYYFHCKRQLWLFAHSLQMEQENENVKIGKVISDDSYSRKKHEIDIESELENIGIKVDFFDKQTNTIHEIKKTDSFEIAHKWQLLYYMYILKQHGVNGVKGVLDYPRMKKKVEVELTDELERELYNIISNINQVTSNPVPLSVEEAKVKINVCKKCSYYELCYS